MHNNFIRYLNTAIISVIMRKLRRLWEKSEVTPTSEESRGRINGLVKRYRVLIVLAVVLLLSVITAAAIVLRNSDKNNDQSATREPSSLELITQQPEPADNIAKITYYSNIAVAHEEQGDYKQAVAAMLKADSFITDRSVGSGRSVNVGIARMYEGLDDKLKAKTYYQKEIERVKSAPENEEILQYLNKKVKELS